MRVGVCVCVCVCVESRRRAVRVNENEDMTQGWKQKRHTVRAKESLRPALILRVTLSLSHFPFYLLTRTLPSLGQAGVGKVACPEEGARGSGGQF